MCLYSSLQELKTLFEIDACNDAENAKLNFLNEWVANIIEEFLDRPGFFLKERTEYYMGTGTQKLLLRSRPVYVSPAIQVFVDETSGNFGQTSGGFLSNTGTGSSLTYGTDFILWTDGDGNAQSRSGILLRLNDYWSKPSVRQRGLLAPFIGMDMGSIKVIYNGGYTIDNMPGALRAAAALLIAKFRNLFPLGDALSSESYEERAVTYYINQRDYIFNLVRPFLMLFKNYHF